MGTPPTVCLQGVLDDKYRKVLGSRYAHYFPEKEE